MSRKVKMAVTVELTIIAEEDTEYTELLSEWAESATYAGDNADVVACNITNQEVIDSK